VNHSWHEIEQLFHEALTLAHTERISFLERACEGDAALRSEIEALLESDEQATSFLSAPVILGSSPPALAADNRSGSEHASGPAGPDPFEFAPGATVGNYRIVRPLGRGGMGAVYEAEDLTLGRHVAIKVLSAVSDSATARARLLTEARTASSLNHRHIVTVHSIERDRDGRDFLVMEYVEGMTLRDRLAIGALETDELLTVAEHISDALAVAHARGIVHRDLKPENVMLNTTGDVKLLDFGIAAHARLDTDIDAMALAQAGVLGTVSYMSPEQAAGEQTDFRSDQFSLGSILYEAASGVHPFRGVNAAQTLAAVRRASPRPLNEIRPGIPDPLRWVIERCLTREPSRRYSPTNELHRQLAMLRARLFEATSIEQAASVPVPRTAIIGRDKESALATRLVLETTARLVTLTGPGGVGKTRLALELANTLAERFANRVFFVDLSPVRDHRDVAKTVATTLRVRDASESDVTSALRRWIRERQHLPMLLVIDNFEHVLDAAPLVGELLMASKSLVVLATSRAALHLVGEHTVVVPPLGLPDARDTTPEQLSTSDAVALFVQRATAAKADFVMTENNAVTIARICQRLDGLPLAIELAAARVGMLSPAAILSRLEHRLDVLTGGPRDAPHRQRSFRTTLEWSEELLDPSERILFRRLAVFSGGCTVEAVEAVCNTREDLQGPVESLVTGLVEKSMVVVASTAEPMRLTLLETIREFAQERLAESDDDDLARRAHAAFCVVLAEEGYGSRGQEQSHWMRRCDLEYPNFRSAHEWLLRNQQFEWGVRLATALVGYWEARAMLAEGLDWLDRLLQLPRQVQQPPWRARALNHMGHLIHLQGDMSTWTRHFPQVLDAVSQLEDPRYYAQEIVNHGVVLVQVGQHDEGRARIEDGLAKWRALGDVTGEARTLANLATVAKITGDVVRARELYRQSRGLFEQTSDEEGIAWSLNHEADAARWEGDVDTARALLLNALDRFQALKDEGGVANCLVDLAAISIEEYSAVAEQHALAALRLLMTTGHSREIARLLETLARVASQQGADDRALRLAGAVAAIRQKYGRYDRLELRHPDDARKFARSITGSQERVGSRAAALWMAGWAAPLTETIEYALATDPSNEVG
jgi:predicted ATPase/serine/threonine protein kinase